MENQSVPINLDSKTFKKSFLLFRSTVVKLRDKFNAKSSRHNMGILRDRINACQDFIKMEFNALDDEGSEIILPEILKISDEKFRIRLPSSFNHRFFNGTGAPETFVSIPKEILEKANEKLSVLLYDETTPIIDVKSAVEFFNVASEAECCVFFNTKVDDDQWFDTAMQFNIFIQQSSLQANNYRQVISCLRNKQKETQCNLPTRKNIRIMFCRDKEQDVKSKLESTTTPNLRNIVYAHIINGVPLAIIGIDKLIKIIDKINFNEEELNCLNIPEYYKKDNAIQKLKYLNQQLFTEKKNLDRLDFTIFSFKEINENEVLDFSEIWSGSIENGILSYKLNHSHKKEDKSSSEWRIMLEIGEKIFKQIIAFKTIEKMPSHPLSKIDPIMYVNDKINNGTKMICIQDEFCAIEMIKFDPQNE